MTSEYKKSYLDSVDFLKPMPKSFFKWHLFSILAFSGLITAFAFIIKYPDVVSGVVIIYTDPQPVLLKPSRSGIFKWTITNKDSVLSRNQTIGYVQNTLSVEKFHSLEGILSTFNIDSIHNPFGTSQPVGYGEFTYNIQAFVNAINEYQTVNTESQYQFKLKRLNERIVFLESLDGKLQHQVKLNKERKHIGDQLSKVDSVLFETKVVALTDYLSNQKLSIDNKSGLLNSEITALSNKVSLNELQSERLNLETTFNSTRAQQYSSVLTYYQTIVADLQKWKTDNLIISPIDGTFKPTRFIPDGSVVSPATDLGYISPKVGKLIGRININSYGAGKLKPGNFVKLSLENYPVDQFGYINTTITSINILPVEKNGTVTYEAILELPRTLKTTFGKTIPYQFLMNGRVEIITEPYSFGGRIIYKALRFTQ